MDKARQCEFVCEDTTLTFEYPDVNKLIVECHLPGHMTDHSQNCHTLVRPVERPGFYILSDNIVDGIICLTSIHNAIGPDFNIREKRMKYAINCIIAYTQNATIVMDMYKLCNRDNFHHHISHNSHMFLIMDKSSYSCSVGMVKVSGHRTEIAIETKRNYTVCIITNGIERTCDVDLKIIKESDMREAEGMIEIKSRNGCKYLGYKINSLTVCFSHSSGAMADSPIYIFAVDRATKEIISVSSKIRLSGRGSTFKRGVYIA